MKINIIPTPNGVKSFFFKLWKGKEKKEIISKPLIKGYTKYQIDFSYNGFYHFVLQISDKYRGENFANKTRNGIKNSIMEQLIELKKISNYDLEHKTYNELKEDIHIIIAKEIKKQ